MLLLNSFSINMVASKEFVAVVRNIERPKDLSVLDSVIGHQQLADMLGVPMNRATVQLQEGNRAIIAQYSGPRLEEGTTTLPEGAKIEWKQVTIVPLSVIDAMTIVNPIT